MYVFCALYAVYALGRTQVPVVKEVIVEKEREVIVEKEREVIVEKVVTKLVEVEKVVRPCKTLYAPPPAARTVGT